MIRIFQTKKAGKPIPALYLFHHHHEGEDAVYYPSGAIPLIDNASLIHL